MNSNSLKNLTPFPKGHKLGLGNKYRLGKKLSEEHKQALINSRRGKKNSEEHNKKLREVNLGNKNWVEKKHSEISKRKIAISHLGIKPSEETRKKLSGANHWNWKNGITPIRKRLYFSKEYKEWRKSVFERDNYTCVICGLNRKNQGVERVILQADHIKPWSLFPELRFDINNGRTLCIKCHRKTDTYGVKALI